jgi:hypothetical protein
MYRHFAFKVNSLAALRTLYRQTTERGIPIKMTLNHGCSLAFYIDDPEGNMIEVYWPTGLHNRQPYGDPFDLDAPEAELIQEVAEIAARAGLSLPPALVATDTP